VHEAAHGLVGEARGSDTGARLRRARSLVAGGRRLGWWLDHWIQMMDLGPIA
jgi:hypothetical protein